MVQIVKNGLALIMNGRKIPVLGIMCLLITAAILIAGLWPFNFHPSNKVEWLKNENGIRFYGQGIVFSPEPLAAQENAQEDASLTIELRVRPLKEYTTMLPSVLTLYGDNHSEQFIFGQWKTQLIIRVPAPRPGSQKRYYEVALNNALIKETAHLITVTSGKETTALYVDGMLKKRVPHYSLVAADQRHSGRLVLGNSPEGTHSWNGAFFGLAIYNRILTDEEAHDHYQAWQKHGQPILPGEKKPVALYLFDEHGGEQIQDHSGNHNDLLVPATFQPLRRVILGMPRKEWFFTRANLNDITINILGFIPFGFFLSAWLWQAKKLTSARACGITIFAGFFLSLAIELTQVYLPTRDSSLLDVIDNIFGTAVGALLLNYAAQFFIDSKKTA